VGNLAKLGFSAVDHVKSDRLLVYCIVHMVLSAWREAVSCKARLAGNGWSFPRGATKQMTASRRARREIHKWLNTALQLLLREWPLTANCALSWIICGSLKAPCVRCSTLPWAIRFVGSEWPF